MVVELALVMRGLESQLPPGTGLLLVAEQIGVCFSPGTAWTQELCFIRGWAGSVTRSYLVRASNLHPVPWPGGARGGVPGEGRLEGWREA